MAIVPMLSRQVGTGVRRSDQGLGLPPEECVAQDRKERSKDEVVGRPTKISVGITEILIFLGFEFEAVTSFACTMVRGTAMAAVTQTTCTPRTLEQIIKNVFQYKYNKTKGWSAFSGHIPSPLQHSLQAECRFHDAECSESVVAS